MEYLLKASAIIVLFYICYKLFLQRETFFEHNRWFLLVGLLTAFTLPFIVIPIYITQAPTEFQNLLFTDANIVATPTVESISILQIISILYLAGVVFFSIRFVIQFYSLFHLLLKTEKDKKGYYTYIKTTHDVSPFSFFKWIVYNPDQFNEDELSQILTHEKVHARQHHSIDILMSQLALIAFWFNPFIWLYKKDLQQNLEFIADHKAQNRSQCKKSYQYLLLKSSVPTHQLALTNNFYNSLIKKRIVMLHKSKSNKINAWKYALILPALALFLMSFNTKKVVMENESEPLNVFASEKSLLENNMDVIIITKDFTDADFEKLKTEYAEKGITLKFKGIKRNAKGEIIAIKIDVSTKTSNANYNINADEPISPIKIMLDNENNSVSIGNASMLHGDSFVFETKDEKHKIHKSHKGNNTLYLHDDDDENIFIIKKDVKVHEIKKGHKTKDIHIISGDNHEAIHVDVDIDEHDIDNNTEVIIIKDKDGNIVKDKIVVGKHKNVWVEEDGASFKVKTIGKDKGNKVLFINSGDQEPLFILDGKEISKAEMDTLDPDTIDKIEVLKGESATTKYGKKADGGAVLITIKK